MTTNGQTTEELGHTEALSLSSSQLEALRAVLDNKTNLLVTGGAGVGKTFLIQIILDWLTEGAGPEGRGYRKDQLAITASTALAALHINGRTFHSWAGIGTGEKAVEQYLQKGGMLDGSRKLIKSTKVLIIEEVSMLDGDFFDKVEAVVRHVKESLDFFGGIRVILFGDFYQLPPVKGCFVFQSKSWSAGEFALKNLTNMPYRQQGQDAFVKILNEVRLGNVSTLTEESLAAMNNHIVGDLSDFTMVFPVQTEVDRVNAECLSKIISNELILISQDTLISKARASFFRDAANKLIPSKIVLKIGCRVMITRNVDFSSGLVNGRVGIVAKYEEPHLWAFKPCPVHYAIIINPSDVRSVHRVTIPSTHLTQHITTSSHCFLQINRAFSSKMNKTAA